MAFTLAIVLFLSVTSSWAQSPTPAPGTTAHTHKPRPTKPPAPDVVTTLQNLGNFNTLLNLVNKAGLANTLLSAPELTLFAPTDDAFAKLPAGTLQALENDPNQLKTILTYHAVPEKFQFKGRFQDTTLTSLDNNKPVRLNVYGAAHTIAAEGVNTTMKNVHIKNGYVHVLDGVMTPPEGNLVDILSSRSDMTQLTNTLKSTGLLDVIQNDMNITVFAPSDSAFANVADKVMNYLLAHPKDLKEVLLYHVVSQYTLYSIGMKHTLTFPTSDRHHDRIMTIEDDSNNVYINDALVTMKDMSAVNGVLHVIDKVLIPARVLLNIEAQGISAIG